MLLLSSGKQKAARAVAMERAVGKKHLLFV
jgi:hypothetical protein